MAVSCDQETAWTGSVTIAQNMNAQASTTTAPHDSKDSEAQEALKAGDVYLDLSEYAEALKQYQSAEVVAKKTGDWLAQATVLSKMGRLQSYLGDNDLALKQVTQALDLFKHHGDNRTTIAANAYGEALTNLAEVSSARGEFLRASKQLDNALDVFQQDQEGEARARLLRGNLAGSLGDTTKAWAEISRALELFREISDKRGEGLAFSAMGLWYSGNEEHHRAIEMDDKAREIFLTIGDSRSEGIALNAMGEAYKNLGEYTNALSKYQSALVLFENIRAPEGALGALYGIASTQFLGKKFDQALASYERLLQLSRIVGNRRVEAHALRGIAESYGAQRRREPAVAKFQNSESFFKSIGDLRGQAMALNAHGEFLLQVGENQKALEVFAQAFSLSEKMDDKGILIATLYNLARANEALGLHEVALSLITKSFTMIEEIRANVASPDFRASYFAAVRKHYDLYIEVLMQLDKLSPGKGFAARAFLVSEQGRARLLLDLLSESRSNIRAGVAKELVEKERRLRGLLRAQAEYQLNLALSGKESTERTEVAAQITDLTSEYQMVQAQLKEQVHFATHGYFNSEHPELSAIVLTAVDPNGTRKDGLMPLPDIYSLDLSAELVVLSACQTALGKDLKGEGLVGLSHSFMSAGAQSVVASLWKVDDRATALLMSEFYKGMLQKGMTPSAALRSAKLKMMHDKQWSAPYYWAGFVLQGEYTNHITVNSHTWLRPVLYSVLVVIVIAATLLALQKRKRRIPPKHFT